MTSILHETRGPTEWLKSEVGTISRDPIILARNDGPYPSGTVLAYAAGSTKLVALVPAAEDSRATAVAVLIGSADPSAADTRAIAVTRLAEVAGGLLSWPAGITVPQQAAAVTALAAHHIVVR
ncbi:MAG: head decoration protein [Rhodospirillaceae bacterium]